MARRKNPAAVALGKMGGQARSPAKADAARENGKRGGRPKKVTADAPPPQSPDQPPPASSDTPPTRRARQRVQGS